MKEDVLRLLDEMQGVLLQEIAVYDDRLCPDLDAKDRAYYTGKIAATRTALRALQRTMEAIIDLK